MGLGQTIKAWFGNGNDASDDANLWRYVRCQRCGEVIKVRVDLRNDPSLDDDGAYVVHKTLVGGTRRCFARMEMTLTFDAQHRLIGEEVTGGTFVEASAYTASLEENASAST